MVSKRPRSPLLNPGTSSQVRLHDNFEMGDIPHHHTPTGDITAIPVPRKQDQIPPSGPLPSLPAPDLWLWPYGWEPSLDTFIQDGNSEGSEILGTAVGSMIKDVNDGSTVSKSLQPFW